AWAGRARPAPPPDSPPARGRDETPTPRPPAAPAADAAKATEVPKFPAQMSGGAGSTTPATAPQPAPATQSVGDVVQQLIAAVRPQLTPRNIGIGGAAIAVLLAVLYFSRSGGPKTQTQVPPAPPPAPAPRTSPATQP